MDMAIKIAATGIKYRTQSLNVAANNMANLETIGFKSNKIYSQSFGEHMLMRVNQAEGEDVGGNTYGVTTGGSYVDFTQGAIKFTGRNLDFSINGDGFFNVRTADGQTKLTRNGQFFISEEGLLTDINGNDVLGENGTIFIGEGKFTTSTDGTIEAEDGTVSRLSITVPTDLNALTRLEDGGFLYNGATAEFSGKIEICSLEAANSDLIDQMSAMIRDSRAFQSCSQVLKMADQVLQKTTTELGRV